MLSFVRLGAFHFLLRVAFGGAEQTQWEEGLRYFNRDGSVFWFARNKLGSSATAISTAPIANLLPMRFWMLPGTDEAG